MILDPRKLWSAQDIAEYASYGLTLAWKMTRQPGFPSPVKRGKSGFRWVAGEVMDWVESLPRAEYEPRERTCLYRHISASGELLYVGISLSLLMRTQAHASNADWFGHVARIDIEWFDTMEEALRAEAMAIVSEAPKHNKAGRPQ